MKKIEIGSKVLVKFHKQETESYQIVTPGEADIFANKISFDSAFGKAVFGKSIHDRVNFAGPNGDRVSLKIIRIK